MKKLLLLFAVLLFSLQAYAQISIAEARDMAIGDEVTIYGVITNDNSLGVIRYIQDETAGIALYPGTGSAEGFAENVTRGNAIYATGILKEYNGLLEIDPILDFGILSLEEDLPPPNPTVPSLINEEVESELIVSEGVTFADAGGFFTVGNHSFSDSFGTSQVYIRNGHPLVGQPIPVGEVDLVGVASQYNDYQLLLRDVDDIIGGTITNPNLITIAEARSMADGSNVTVQGIVLNGGELGSVRYIQDATGGIAAYPGGGSAPGFVDNVSIAYEVVITGVLTTYNGLLEISPISSYEVIDINASLPEPALITTSQLNEDVEGRLVKVNQVMFADAGTTFASGSYAFTDNTGTTNIYVNGNTNIVGTEVPVDVTDVVGIASQFNDYQLLPRSVDDIGSEVINPNPELITIAEARALDLGETVTVQGVVTHGSSLGIIRYFQDETGGIAAYPGTGSQDGFPDNVTQGDLIEVTGVLKEYNGLLEIDPIISYQVISSDNTLPEPLATDATGVNEENEAILLGISNVTFADGGGDFASGTYVFTDANGNESQVYLRSGHPWIGAQIPLANVNIKGIGSQFSAQYQLLPRDISDLEIASTFYITSSVEQSNITTDGFTISWTTNQTGTSTVNYGLTPDLELGQFESTSSTDIHSVDLSGLEPATFYYIQVQSDNGSETASSNLMYVSTQSLSSGQIDVYFNKSVDPTFATEGNEANYWNPAAINNLIVSYIDNAQNTIDVCFYNNNRTPIVQALNNAVARGVQVRYVFGLDGANTALTENTLDFPTIGANGEYIMHNKFIIFDVDDVDNCKVLGGSMNLTDVNMLEDANNVIVIQDQALAKAYKLEFVEMWGGDGANPSIFTAVSGSNKTSNTPQLFNINGITTELYFSPTDNTTNRIIDAINTADTDLQIALLSFTKNELGTAVANAFNNDVDVRGILENTGDTGTEFDFLVNTVGVDFVQGSTPGQIHHKYCIIDANDDTSDPQVVTGSHNWSNSAENNNDENTLILHSAEIANLYIQEFEQRWCEIQGGECYPDDGGFTNIKPIEMLNIQVTPNPTTDFITVNLENNKSQKATISIYSTDGKLMLGSVVSNNSKVYVGMLPTGLYNVYISQGDVVGQTKLIKQ